MNNLLIGTRNALVCWDGQKTIVSEGNYYGITWGSDYVYCSRNPLHNPISLIDVFDKNLNFMKTLNIPAPLNNVHQILMINENLYITYTQKDTLTIFNKKNIRHLNWTGFEDDKYHLNSIWAKDNKIYVVESGLGGETRPPTVQVLDKAHNPISRIAIPDAIHIHNVYIENNYLYCCGKYGLIQYNLETNKTLIIDLRRDKENGFFRGLARTDDYWYIGESQILPRERRDYGDADILVLNNDFRIVDIIMLKDTGQVQDFRVTDEMDLAHNGIDL